MQKSEFAEHSILKCQFQSVLFAERLKITRNPLETAGDGGLMTREKVFFLQVAIQSWSKEKKNLAPVRHRLTFR